MTDRQTPEEKARADAYAAGVLAERDHTLRVIVERDAARARLAAECAAHEETQRRLAALLAGRT